jgi:hypothetical protein
MRTAISPRPSCALELGARRASESENALHVAERYDGQRHADEGQEAGEHRLYDLVFGRGDNDSASRKEKPVQLRIGLEEVLKNFRNSAFGGQPGVTATTRTDSGQLRVIATPRAGPHPWSAQPRSTATGDCFYTTPQVRGPRGRFIILVAFISFKS